MGRSKSYTVNPFFCGLAAACALMFFVVCASFFAVSHIPAAIVTLIFGLIFLLVALFYGCKINLTQEGVSKTLFGITLFSYTWDEIKEVGISGTKVLKQKNSKQAGSIFLYLSTVKMSETDRFNMMLRWPPLDKSKLFFTYSHERYVQLQLFANRRIVQYNIGDLRP